MPKKIPMRMCVSCREMKPKKELIRIVKSPEGEISIDEKGKKSGRGAYICPSLSCFKRAVKQKQLERAFESEIQPEVLEKIGLEIERLAAHEAPTA